MNENVMVLVNNGELTTKEGQLLNFLGVYVEGYEESGDYTYSDCMFDDFVSGLGWTPNSTKGVLGSIIRKGYIGDMDVNGEYNVYYLRDKARTLFGYTKADV